MTERKLSNAQLGALKIKERLGEDWFHHIGSLGGKKKTGPTGFQLMTHEKITSIASRGKPGYRIIAESENAITYERKSNGERIIVRKINGKIESVKKAKEEL